MSEPFLGEIKMVGFNFAPRGWANCDGQLLPINQNQSLYSLLGTTFGGDGSTTFALPDLRGRAPMHRGDFLARGEKGGAETVTLTVSELGGHNHLVRGTKVTGDKFRGSSIRCFASSSDSTDPVYGNPAQMMSMHSGIISQTGGGQAHNNMQPLLTIRFCIALQGLFPSRN